jgi:hypothetical protein
MWWLFHVKAASNAHMDVIQWWIENGCGWHVDVAAWNGHLHVVQWCCENVCPWSARTCANANANGLLDIFQWCRANGCNWNDGTYSNAVIKWCREDNIFV